MDLRVLARRCGVDAGLPGLLERCEELRRLARSRVARRCGRGSVELELGSDLVFVELGSRGFEGTEFDARLAEGVAEVLGVAREEMRRMRAFYAALLGVEIAPTVQELVKRLGMQWMAASVERWTHELKKEVEKAGVHVDDAVMDIVAVYFAARKRGVHVDKGRLTWQAGVEVAVFDRVCRICRENGKRVLDKMASPEALHRRKKQHKSRPSIDVEAAKNVPVPSIFKN